MSKWIDSGLLKGWKIPGSSDRRVDAVDLKRFCIENGIPVRYLLHETDAPLEMVVWIMDEPTLLYPRIVNTVLSAMGNVNVEYVPTKGLSFKAGLEQPDVAVINYDLHGRQTVLDVQKVLPQRSTLIVLVTGEMSPTAESVLNKNHATIMRY